MAETLQIEILEKGSPSGPSYAPPPPQNFTAPNNSWPSGSPRPNAWPDYQTAPSPRQRTVDVEANRLLEQRISLWDKERSAVEQLIAAKERSIAADLAHKAALAEATKQRPDLFAGDQAKQVLGALGLGRLGQAFDSVRDLWSKWRGGAAPVAKPEPAKPSYPDFEAGPFGYAPGRVRGSYRPAADPLPNAFGFGQSSQAAQTAANATPSPSGPFGFGSQPTGPPRPTPAPQPTYGGAFGAGGAATASNYAAGAAPAARAATVGAAAAAPAAAGAAPVAASGFAAVAAAAIPLAAGLYAVNVAASFVANRLNDFSDDIRKTGMIAQSFARNDNFGAIIRIGNATAESWGRIPLVGQAVEASMKVWITTFDTFHQVVQSFIARGHQLADWSPKLTGATVNAEIRSMQGDIKEADVLGPNLARMIEAQSVFDNDLRELLLPIKEFLTGVLAGFMETTGGFIHAVQPLIKLAVEILTKLADVVVTTAMPVRGIILLLTDFIDFIKKWVLFMDVDTNPDPGFDQLEGLWKSLRDFKGQPPLRPGEKATPKFRPAWGMP